MATEQTEETILPLNLKTTKQRRENTQLGCQTILLILVTIKEDHSR